MEIQKSLRKERSELRGLYKHFKGELYIVVDVGINTETEEYLVVYKNYKNPELVWCRPIDDFLSEVDHKKYPNATQKMKFEKIRMI